MFLCSRAGIERAEIPALAGFGVFLRRIQTILTGFEFSDHKKILLRRYIHNDEGAENTMCFFVLKGFIYIAL